MTAIGLGACSDGTAAPATTLAIEADSAETGALSDLPLAARVATGTAEPRSGEYWTQWSTCGPDSRADEAAANGGRDAGWVLLDDLLDDPGIALGNHVVPTCEAAVGLLSRDLTTSGTVDDLASHLLTTQLNLNVGAETCPAAEESVIAGQVMLASLGYDGSGGGGESPPVADDDATEAVVELLAAYNAGQLCR